MKAIITGAASGIGRAVAFQLSRSAAAREGKSAQVLLVDLNKEKLDEVAGLLRAEGVQAEVYAGDLTDPEVPAKVVAAAEKAFGGLDVLISNAGIIGRASLLELSLADYDRAFQINTRATWLLGKAAHPLLSASRGCIVATASMSAFQPTSPLGAYSASKAALVMLIKQMALEWGPDGIRCNTVSPGSTHTGMTDQRFSNPELREAAAARNPLHMVGTADHQAAAICFLASPEAAYITGADLLVDGGMSTMLMKAAGAGDPWKK
jgi:NAD(P)-dependent dehydrogenase (short-subunit alcohol dehydrogenase family)